MRGDDVPVAEEISNDAFYDVELRTCRAGNPDPERRSPARSGRWIARTQRLLDTDAGGAWVAEDETGVVGFATSVVREGLWLLITFAMRPGRQGEGIGKRLLDAAEEYGRSCDRGMLAASDDPLALRRYHRSGFALYPQLIFRGTVDRSALPAVDGIREGTDDDLEWIDDLDRSLRGGPHGPDHAHLRATGRMIVTTDRTGYAYTYASDACALVAGRDEETATQLLWECLAGATDEFEISHVTTANPWAIDVAMAARLSMSTSGYLAVRGMSPPAPYIHNGALG